ncbi:unnamed protein product [Dimorphilus gyrociliatus]|uniref:Uncharacterized protein n=1 Tax=Dimorphilus gyrociliatus TaxID=2664684 RepID=A0A7I8VV64_9ANNE|nr:unnamed protein product [Dimorphilus gyrociliatus]
MALASENSHQVQSANEKFDAAFQRAVEEYNKAQRTISARIRSNQQMVLRRFERTYLTTKLNEARLTNDKKLERAIRAQLEGFMNNRGSWQDSKLLDDIVARSSTRREERDRIRNASFQFEQNCFEQIKSPDRLARPITTNYPLFKKEAKSKSHGLPPKTADGYLGTLSCHQIGAGRLRSSLDNRPRSVSVPFPTCTSAKSDLKRTVDFRSRAEKFYKTVEPLLIPSKTDYYSSRMKGVVRINLDINPLNYNTGSTDTLMKTQKVRNLTFKYVDNTKLTDDFE